MTARAEATGATGRDAIHRQFLRYILVGLTSTALDATSYHFALGALTTGQAKGLGYLVGMIFSIVCNYRWSFAYDGARQKTAYAKCVLVYGLALLVNVAANHIGLMIFGAGRYGVILAFLLAVGASTVFNFAGMRWWVFR